MTASATSPLVLILTLAPVSGALAWAGFAFAFVYAHADPSSRAIRLAAASLCAGALGAVTYLALGEHGLASPVVSPVWSIWWLFWLLTAGVVAYAPLLAPRHRRGLTFVVPAAAAMVLAFVPGVGFAAHVLLMPAALYGSLLHLAGPGDDEGSRRVLQVRWFALGSAVSGLLLAMLGRQLGSLSFRFGIYDAHAALATAEVVYALATWAATVAFGAFALGREAIAPRTVGRLETLAAVTALLALGAPVVGVLLI